MFETVFAGLLTKTFIVRASHLGSLIPLTDHARAYSVSTRQKKGPVYLLRQKIAEGQLNFDSTQTIAVNALQEVYDNVRGYTPGKFVSSKCPKGLYIYGSNGSGKTMLMDLFFQSVKTSSKKRAHFNDFMENFQYRIDQMKEKQEKTKIITGNITSSANPVRAVAKQLVKEVWLLCVDDFQVNNLSDAMLVKQLFTEMFDCGMVMVATSKRSPDDLYKKGSLKSSFMPFIPILKNHCNVVSVYRGNYGLDREDLNEELEEKYFLTGQKNTESEIEKAFTGLCFTENEKPGPKTVKILNKKVSFKRACGRILFASFQELCDRPFSTNDYLEIAKTFNVVFIKGIPKMRMENKNQVRRFITLIDSLYENKVRVILSAEAQPEALFSASLEITLNEAQKKKILSDLNPKKDLKSAVDKSYSESEEVFAFQRTASRIREMCSNNFWDSCGA